MLEPISPSRLQDPLEPIWYSSDDEISDAPGPVHLIDQVVPLLYAAAELPAEDVPPETAQQMSVRDISQTNSAEVEVESEGRNALDDRIVSTVFDTHLETHPEDIPQRHQPKQSHWEPQPKSISRVLFSNGERLQLPVQFDFRPSGDFQLFIPAEAPSRTGLASER